MLNRKQQKNTFLQSNNLNLQSYLRGFVGEEGGIFLGYSIDMKSTCSKFKRKWNDDTALNILPNDGRNETNAEWYNYVLNKNPIN
jgi:hypothetical protein